MAIKPTKVFQYEQGNHLLIATSWSRIVRWPKFFHAQSFGNHFCRDTELWCDARGDVVERSFVGSQPVGIAGGLRGLDGSLKHFAQRFGRHKQASGEFVSLPLHSAVFNIGYGEDVIEPFGGGGVFQSAVNIAVQNEMANFVGDGEAQAVFQAWTHEGAFVHENGFQIAHERGVNVQLLSQAVDGNQFKPEIKFGEVEDFHGQRTSRRVRSSQPVGFLPDTLFGIVWRIEFARVVQGRVVPLIMPRSFSKSSRDGFWPEMVRKKAGSVAISSSFSKIWSGMRPASTAA